MNPVTTPPPCRYCNGLGFITVTLKGKTYQRTCVKCGGSKQAGPRTK